MKKYGLDPIKHVILLALGNIPERVQALLTGAVDAVDLNHPGDVIVMRNGFKALWDLRKEVNYPSMSVVTRRKSVKEDRDTVLRMVKAHTEAIHFLKANKEFSLKVLSRYLRMNDRELLEEAYNIYEEDFLSLPRPTVQGHDATYEYVAQQRPEVLKHKPEEFMNLSIVAELEKSGFFKQLAATYR